MEIGNSIDKIHLSAGGANGHFWVGQIPIFFTICLKNIFPTHAKF
jgi:hypothetical protein